MSANTAARLTGYYPFSSDVIESVSEFADKQSTYKTYQEFFDSVQVGETIKWQSDGCSPVEILDVRPKEHDPEKALFYHLPMANPLDSNQIYQIATIAGTNPNTRIIAVGNPSGGKYKAGALNRSQRSTVSVGTDLLPLVLPAMRYAADNNISTSQEVGYSYGALRANVAAYYATHSVANTVAIEPVVGQRSILKLGMNFAATAKMLDHYVNASDMPTFEAARNDSVSAIHYNRGLARLSNFAIARMLAKTNFVEWADKALSQHPDMTTTIAWGSESELATDSLLKSYSSGLPENRGADRINPIRLPGQKHALANDIHLQAAIILQAISE